MTDYERVNVALDPMQKGEWDEYIEDSHEVESMSQLVRTSVERRMHGEDLGDSQTATDTTQTVSGLEGLEDALIRIEQSLDDIQTRVKRLESETVTQGAPKDFQTQVWQSIPKVEDETQPPSEKGIRMVELWDFAYEDGYPPVQNLSSEGLTDEDKPLGELEKAIQALQQGGATVRTAEVEEDGETVTYVWRPA